MITAQEARHIASGAYATQPSIERIAAAIKSAAIASEWAIRPWTVVTTPLTQSQKSHVLRQFRQQGFATTGDEYTEACEISWEPQPPQPLPPPTRPMKNSVRYG